MLAPFGFANSIEFVRSRIAEICRANPGEVCRCLSVGAGAAMSEVNIVQWLLENNVRNFSFECADINKGVLERGRREAAEKGVAGSFSFTVFDVNTWRPRETYRVVVAFQSLHHVLELEKLFDKIRTALHPDGYFMMDDMIGRNGHQRWPEARRFVDALWRELPEKYRYNRALKRLESTFEDWDCSTEGFEGIRAQDILPLLIQKFHFDFFFAFGNIIDPFIDRSFGPNFNPDLEWDRAFIDRVHALDMEQLESGIVKPTHIMAAVRTRPVVAPTVYRHFTPQFCVRYPDRRS